MFLSRLNIFADDNKYYLIGGQFNDYSGSVRMPNCTSYAYLRMEEAMELQKKDNYLIRTSGGFGNAKTWFSTTPLPKGYDLKEGSVAVFDGNAGHVLFVEEMIDKTHAIITESQYDDDKTLRNWKFWNRRTVELVVGKATLSGVGKLIGFIYPEIHDLRTHRNSKEQVEITEDFVNVRKKPNGEVTNVGCYCPVGIFDVLDSKEDNGWIWYKLDENCWVREGTWLIHYPADSGELERLKIENARLKEDMADIYSIIERWL